MTPRELILKHLRALAAMAVVGLMAGLLYGFLTPKWYTANISLVTSQNGNPAASLAASLPGLSAMLLPGAGAEVERIEAVLTTNAVADAVIKKFELAKLYQETYIEHARKALWKHCWIKSNRKAGTVVLSCEDTSPTRARDMAAYFGEVGNELFARVSTSSAGEERHFLEQRVKEAQAEVVAASQALREFQERYKIVDISEQSRAVVSAMATIQADLLSLEMQRDYAKSFAARSEASVMQLDRKVGILRQKMAALESPGSAAHPSSDGQSGAFFPGAMSLPGRRAQVEPLIRELKIREAVLLALTQRYEMAKVDAVRDTSTFQVLDPPTLPTYKSRPSRLLAALAGLLAGVALGFLALVLLDRLRHSRARSTASAERLEGSPGGQASFESAE